MSATHKSLALLVAALAAAALSAFPVAAAGEDEHGAKAGLHRTVHEAIHEGGPLFTAAERAVIERKCGYAKGEWDGFQANMNDGIFHCTNGRRLDDPEIRSLLAAAQPRIQARVQKAMNRPEVRAAIAAVAAEARDKALAAHAARHGK